MLASPVNQPPGSTVNSRTRSESVARSVTGLTNAGHESNQSETLFVVRRLDTSAEPVLLTSGRWSVGTADGNRLRITADGVGARHCLIIATPLRTIIKSWDAQTWLNGQAISDSELRPGDQLKIGEALFSVCPPESNELISQLPCVSGSSVASDDDRNEEEYQTEQTTGRVPAQLSRVDELTETLDALSDELHGREESAVRLDQMIDQLQQTTQPPHVDSETDRSSRDFTAEPTGRIDRQPDGSLCEGDELVSSKAVETEREQLAIEFGAKSRQLDAQTDSLETRSAVLDAQTCEISERLAQLERERQDLNGARSDVEQQRHDLARQQEELCVGLEELDYQREAVRAEADDLRSLYETLNEKFPEAATALADDVDEQHAATGEDHAALQPIEDGDADAEINEVDDASAENSRVDEVSDLCTLAADADASDSSSDCTNTHVEVGTTSAGSGVDDSDASSNKEASTDSGSDVSRPGPATRCQAVSNEQDLSGPEESLRSRVLENSDESSWEVSQLILERIRFGRLVEELRPGASVLAVEEVHEVEEIHEDEDTPVAVGAASLVSRNVTTNAMRSREAAVRELDELVLAATDSVNISSTTSGPGLPNHAAESTAAADVSRLEFTDAGSPDEPEHNEFDDSIDDGGVANDVTQIDETDREAVVAEVEDVEEVATDDLAFARSDEATESGSPISLLDRLKETIATEFDASTETDFAPTGDDEDASTASDTVNMQAEETFAGPGALLSSMFDLEEDRPIESDAADPEAGEQPAAPVEDSSESSDTPVDAEPESGDNLRSQLADMFDLPELTDHSEEPSSDAPLDERFSSLYVDRDDDVDVEITEPVEDPKSTEPVAGTSSEENQISSYMQQLLARNRLQTGAPDPEPPTPEPAQQDVVEPVVVSENDDDRSWLEEGPLHKQDRRQVQAETAAFRELANQSARSAVDAAQRKQLRTAVIVKTLASVSALAVGAISMLMELPMVFGFGVLGIGLVFTVDLLITIARNWTEVARLARARLASNRSSDDAPDETEADELTPDVPLRRHDDADPHVDAKVPEDRPERVLQAEIKPACNAVPDAPTEEFESRLRELFGEPEADATDEKLSDTDPE